MFLQPGGQHIPANSPYKDLDILTSKNFQFSQHCNHIVKTAHARANLILRAFPHSYKHTLCDLFSTYVRPLVEYCNTIWSPYTLELIDLIENVQRSFTRRIPSLRQLTYPERLRSTNIPSLEIRQL